MTDTAEPTTSAPRNAYVDFLRAFSIIVVVLWHWAFTILVWGPTGPSATNPIGFFSGLWLFTWLLQVLPLFFYVGGYVHLMAWQRARARGEHLGHFVWRNLRKLAVPALVLLVFWVAIGTVVTAVWGVSWLGRVVLLIISPLWFLAVYLLLIALIPVWFALLRRFGMLTLVVWIVGLVVIVDILRFRYGLTNVAFLNLVLVWGLAFLLGFSYDRITKAPRQVPTAMLWGGLFGLVGLTFSGLYPGSMVGVPGEASNMAPPTLCIVALLSFQVGVAELVREPMERWLATPRVSRVVEVVNRFAMPVFLFHTTGMAIGRTLYYLAIGRIGEREVPDLTWWLQRPLFVLLSLVCTLPVIALFGRFGHRRQTVPAAPG